MSVMLLTEFWLVPEWRWTRFWRGFEAPPSEALSTVQYVRLRSRLPFLYLALATISVAGALVVVGQDLSVLNFTFLGLLFFASAVRFIMLIKRRGIEPTVDEARKALLRTFVLTLALTAPTSIWAVIRFYENTDVYRLVSPVYLTLGALAAANCLASLPRAAAAALVICLGPISAAMIFSGDIRLIVTGVAILVVGDIHLRLLLKQFNEVGRNVRLQYELGLLADCDALTGLHNRRAFERAIKARAAGEQPFFVAMLDLDLFKPVNDVHGHGVGDELLRAFAKRLSANCREADLVARLGGDEFAVILDAPVADGTVERWTNRMQSALSKPYSVSRLTLTVSASIGTALFMHDAKTIEELLAHADRALYRSKAVSHGNAQRIAVSA